MPASRPSPGHFRVAADNSKGRVRYLRAAMNRRQARGGKVRVAPLRLAVSRTRTRAVWLTSTQVLAGPLEWVDFRQGAVSVGAAGLGCRVRCIFPRTNL
jgi:hypothetical protein